MNARTKKTLSYAIKAAIFIVTAVVIYKRLTNKHELRQFGEIVAKLNHTYTAIVLSAVVLLMLLNWGLEAGKWKYLTSRLAPLTFWNCIEGVFCGLSWAIFTPNRFGEYGGRVMFLPPRKRIHGVFAMAVGSFGQNVVTNVLGAAALMWFIYTFFHIAPLFYFGIWTVVSTFMTMMILFYFNIRWTVFVLNKVKFLHKFHRFFDIMGRYNLGELARIMGFCVARFAVFSFQYYLILHLLIPSISAHDIFMMVFILFLIQSALPSLDIVDVGVRNITAVELFKYVTNEKIAVMAAVSAIWFINLIIPAILGSVFVFKVKFFDSNDV